MPHGFRLVDRVELGDDWNNGKTRPAKIFFKEPRTFAVFTVDELKEILKYWIIGEEIKYPQPKFKGRWLLFDEIKKVFYETPLKSEPKYLNTTNTTNNHGKNI